MKHHRVSGSEASRSPTLVYALLLNELDMATFVLVIGSRKPETTGVHPCVIICIHLYRLAL